MTESESTALFNNARQRLSAWEEALDRLGITVIPKPTNVEKLDRHHLEWIKDKDGTESLGEYLDSLGWAKSDD